MTPYEMEQQLNNLNTRTTRIEQILPTLATKEDLEDVKRHTGMLVGAVHDDMRLLAQQMATGAEVQELRREMRGMGDDVRFIAEQVAILSTGRRPGKKRPT